MSGLPPWIATLKSCDPRLLSLAELRDLHSRLGAWLEAAESAAQPPDEAAMKTARDALTALTRERNERQSDERRDT